jgi:sugar/nucleoside kinase (ribokinase family)
LFDIVTVGHFVIDQIVVEERKSPSITLGGPPTFVSLTSTALGAKTGVVSKVGRDFHTHAAWLRKNKVDLSYVQTLQNTLTTRFTLKYSGDERTLNLENLAPPILPKDIATSLHTKVIHVSPVLDEVPFETIHELRKRTSTLSLDPQGLLRFVDERGKVKPKRLDNMEVLKNIDILKSSINEAKIIGGTDSLHKSIEEIQRYGPKTVLVTMGKEGTLASFGMSKKLHTVPAYEPRIIKDVTGAGDAFIGAFLAEHVKNKENLWCCCVGSAAASFLIERIGPTLPEKAEIYERATKIYEKAE